MHKHITRAGLGDILDKVDQGKRLSFDDGVRLYNHPDINAVGWLANLVRERLHGSAAYYNVNLHINYSNKCYLECAFCAFGKKMNDPEAYEYSMDEILNMARAADAGGCTELHVVGGLHPRWKLPHYVEMLSALKREVPRIHLKCFTAVEIEHIARLARLSIEDCLQELMAAGLDSLPGGGAEIFAWRARKEICEPKQDAERWLSIHRGAHGLGLKSNCTMLYGHIETTEERVDHLIQLRELQDDTGGFQCFVPLAFHPENTHLAHLRRPTAAVDLRNLAVSRLMLDNIPHIKAYWIMQEIYLAQISLAYGVDDVDGTVQQEKIYHMAGAQTPEHMSVVELRRMIVEAGREPVERNSVYHRVVRDADGSDWEEKEPVAATV